MFGLLVTKEVFSEVFREAWFATAKMSSEEEFISCYYLTNGCPRYINSYIRTGTYNRLYQELTDQFVQKCS